MNKNQKNMIFGFHVGDFVKFVFSRSLVKFVFSRSLGKFVFSRSLGKFVFSRIYVEFESLGLFGGYVCGLCFGLTAGRVQGVLKYGF